MTKEEIRKFIIENKIVSRLDFQKRFQYKYHRFFRKLSNEEKEELLPKRIKNSKYSDLNSYNSLKNFISDNKIVSRSDFGKRFTMVYLKFLKLSKENQEKLLPTISNDYCFLKSKEDFVKFIQENNILDRVDFRNRFPGALSRLDRLFSYDDSESIIPHIIHKINYPSLKNKEDFSIFIKSNNITSRTEFSDRFSGAYNKFLSILTEEEQNDLLPSKFNNYKYLKSKEDWNKFIKENNISSRSQLKDFSGLEYKFRKLPKEIQDTILPSKINRYNIKDKKNIKLLIDTEEIKTRSDLHKLYPSIYDYYLTLSKKDQDDLLPKIRNYYPELVDKSSFSNFIKENKIVTRYDFYCRFPGAWSRFNKKLSEEEKDEILPIVDKSSGELYLINLFEENTINFESEKSFIGLKDSISLRYDFYLPDYNILVEYHGGQHFDTTCYYYTESNMKHDKMKYDYAINNKITILYFTREKDIYEKFGYFTEVITDPNILINKIKGLA